jgi:phage/plasmid-like protein (TIGR03299 family)
MPAYFDTGFSVREPMWHGEGFVLDEYPESWDDARLKAGLLWEPTDEPGYSFVQWTGATPWDAWLNQFPEDGLIVVDQIGVVRPLKDHKLIVRDDNRDVLGVVGDGYELLTHAEMGDILEAILGIDNVKFETAGSCRGGAQVWALAYLDEPYTVVGDDTQTYPFIALLNSHDGSGACKLTRTQVRVVCWNTYNAASMEGERSGLQFVFRHTSGIHDRIEEAKAALDGVRDDVAAWDELSRELFGMKVDEATFQHFMADFIPEPPAEVVSDRVRNNIDKARKLFKHLYLDSVTTEAHRGTALGLLDASVEYLDHVRGYRNQDTYMGRTLLRPEPMKARTLTLIREHVR